MMPTAEQLLAVFRTYLGVAESPDGSNRTRVGVEFGWNGVAWCAETVSVVARRSGITDWWTASTDQMESWARAGRSGSKWLSSTSTPRPGDICVWDFKGDGTANHVSVVESVRSDGMLVTLGGNEQNRCQRAVRSRSALRGFIRLPFTAPKPASVPAPPKQSVKHPGLHEGSTGIAVVEYQTKLNKVAGIRLDLKPRRFGPKTAAATVDFKRYFKLMPPDSTDSNVGDKTWALLDYLYALKTGK